MFFISVYLFWYCSEKLVIKLRKVIMIAVIYQLYLITFETFILYFIDLLSNWVLTHYYNLQKNE